jgi:hypothetical protein
MAPKNDPVYFKEYYEKNKQKYKDVYNTVIRCESCKCDVQKLNLSKHLKTKKHQSLSQVQNNTNSENNTKLKDLEMKYIELENKLKTLAQNNNIINE